MRLVLQDPLVYNIYIMTTKYDQFSTQTNIKKSERGIIFYTEGAVIRVEGKTNYIYRLLRRKRTNQLICDLK